ncbi:hypothetical protein Patl1_15757 [Pistacia atlantica]|uniref:Uncharacterized protein n=1 Tax=Pistacia atlantica TaxID=434234 RepID=A0ACC1B8A1_9ROSI|nr:hypothetical protein Patl1_15757 [Pistacia atlantica]
MSDRNDCHSAKVYNGKEVSNWQIPNKVTKLRKKQDDGISKDHLTSVPSTNITIKKAFAPTTFRCSFVNKGGHDACNSREPRGRDHHLPTDLIKRKLRDSGTPVTSLDALIASEQVASN